LRAANAKFTRRFAYIEHALHAAGRSPEESSLQEMDDLWNEAKRHEAKLNP
jgi:ATP diphosphatase